MLTIQDVGTEILNNNPRNFYVFGGTEYGIKKKYLSILKNHYGKLEEYPNVESILSMMSVNHLIPLEPAVYVVRYDEEFVASISESFAKNIGSTNIIGTIICIYESDKHFNKIAKFLPNNSVRIDSVSTNFMIKYLHSDFPHLPDKLINLSAKHCENYNDAQNMCKSMSAIEPERFFELTDSQILSLFGKSYVVSIDSLKIAIATKNFKYLARSLDLYDNYSDIFYAILSTMIELEKVLSSKNSQSDFKEYAKYWFEPDVYNMFMLTYNELQKIRTYASDEKSSLIYLFGLMLFKKIPSVEFMETY